VIVFYAASTHADCSDDLAVELQRDAAWEGDQAIVGHFDVVQRAARLGCGAEVSGVHVEEARGPRLPYRNV
jgi:hypothetical protein